MCIKILGPIALIVWALAIFDSPIYILPALLGTVFIALDLWGARVESKDTNKARREYERSVRRKLNGEP